MKNVISKKKSINNIRSTDRKKPRQTSLNLETSNGYNLPSVDLLYPPVEGLAGPSDDVLARPIAGHTRGKHHMAV